MTKLATRLQNAALLALLAALPALGDPAPYCVSGYFVFSRPNADRWREAIQTIQAAGGDTLIQFGPTPVLRTPGEVAALPAFAGAKVGGQDLVPGMATALRARHPGNRLGRIWTYATEECFGAALLARPGLDRQLEGPLGPIWALVLPSAAPADRAETFNGGADYDLVLVAGRRADSVAMLLEGADAAKLQVFVGLPAAPMDPRQPWAPSLAALPLFLELDRRLLQDYHDRHGSHDSFVGVYQSVETAVSRRCVPQALELYRQQHAQVRSLLPGKRILVSPYWDARKFQATGTPAAEIGPGIQLIANTDVDIIAPQDGRGTGKLGLFGPEELDQPVDLSLAWAAGNRTYRKAYHATTGEFYAAARSGLDRLGRPVQLWANLEAFEPGPGSSPCGYGTNTRRTTKERLDQAVACAGLAPSKLISYMWDGYFDCRGGCDSTLGEDVRQDGSRPILVELVRESRAGVPGLALAGYNLTGQLLLRGRDGRGGWPELAVPIQGQEACPWPEGQERPGRLQRFWIPCPQPIQPGLTGVVRDGLGRTSNQASLYAKYRFKPRKCFSKPWKSSQAAR